MGVERVVIRVPDGAIDPRDLVVAMEKSIEAVRRGMGDGQGALFIPHHSKYQARGDGGRFVALLSDERRLDAAERAGYIHQGYAAALAGNIGQFTSGEMKPKATIQRMRKLLRHNYTTLFELGMQAAGNPITTSDEDLGALERVIREQFGFLDGFLADVLSGHGKLVYDDRAHMHAMHGRVAYWLGWVMGNRDPARQIQWVLHPDKEHCKSCFGMATMGDVGGGYWTPDAMLRTGLLPHSGRLDCKGYYCGCELHERFVRGRRAADGPRPGNADWVEATGTLRWVRNADGDESG